MCPAVWKNFSVMWTSGFGKKKGRPAAVALEVDVEERPDEPLRLRQVLAVGLAGVRAARADGRDGLEMLRDLPVEVDVGEDRLAAAGHRLLGELEDQHLGELADLPVAQPDQVRREEEVDRVPADRAGEVALQGGGELDHVREQHLRVLGRAWRWRARWAG